MAGNNTLTFTDSGFDTEVLKSEEPVLVDFAKGGNRTPEFVGMNPNMRMPVLEDGDYCLWESNVILQYLASLKPEGGLLPEETKAHLQIVKWQFWDSAHWEFSLAFEGLSDDDLWRRADPRLLSVGELAGHVALWEAEYTDVESPLRDKRFGYYTNQVTEPVRLDLGVATGE